MSGGKPLMVNGWTLFAHPIFLDQLDALTVQVEALKRGDTEGYIRKNATKGDCFCLGQRRGHETGPRDRRRRLPRLSQDA